MQTLEPFLTGLAESPHLQAALALAAALIGARVVDWLLTRGLTHWTRRTDTTVDDRLLALLHRPVRVTVVLVGVGVAAALLGLPPTLAWLLQATLQSLAILVWLTFAVRSCSLLLEALSRRAGEAALVQPRTLQLFNNLTQVLVIGAALYLALLAWDINITGWLASAGIIGIAVGFAAKDTLANLFAGVFILADAPYKLGDFIVLDSGERGRVTQIGIRSTRLLTLDDIEITVPNAVMGNAKITNESGGPWEKQRVRVQVSVAYGTDVDQVRQLLLEVAAAQSDVCSEPEPRVRFRSFGDSGLNFELLCWIDEPVLRGRVLDALNTAVYKGLNAKGIEIPYPKRDLYIRQMPPPPTDTAT
jgi:MscS family membrane protein